MQFILVNDQAPCRPSACSCCRVQLGLGCVRAISVHDVYCGYACYARHRKAGAAAVETHS
jgi:hypothetical protein